MNELPFMEVRLASKSSGRILHLPVRAGESIARTVWLSGMVEPAALCSGLGHCGLCRVRFIFPQTTPAPLPEEYHVLGESAIKQGWRLGCRHVAQPGMVIEVPAESRCAEANASRSEQAEGALVAVDLGTTSIQWKAVTPAGAVLASGHCLNPQLGAGSDVMSRIAAALNPETRGLLRDLVVRTLRGIVQQIPARVSALCVAGNTAMTAIFLDRDPSGLAGAPYTVPDAGSRFVELPDLPPVWIPFQPAPFVGGDIDAGVTALLHAGVPCPFLLADMGTNGEVALVVDRQTVFAGSVPLGPALEGIGLRYGVMAGQGAVVEFILSPQGLQPRMYGNEQATAESVAGIAGTGYLSLITQLRLCGVLNAQGQPVRDTRLPLAARVLKGLHYPEKAPWRLDLPFGMALTAEDVEALLKIRAAFSLAVRKIIEAAEQVSGAGAAPAVWALAGALGEHVPRQALELLGFVPLGLGSRLRCMGNTSLQGALGLLHEPALRTERRNWHVVDVTASATFAADYLKAMRFESWNAGVGTNRL